MTYHPVPTAPAQTVTISGQLVYVGGPWGTNRPVRRFVNVNYVLYEPNAMSGPNAGSGSWAVGTTTVDADGRFTLTADATGIPQNGQTVEDVLELQDYSQDEWETIPIDGVTWGRSGTQDVGKLKVGWDPPLKTLAWVDSVSFHDTRGLALRLISLIETAPERPAAPLVTRIVLPREPGQGEEYTPAQEMFKSLMPSRVKKDFPERLREQLNKIPLLHSSSKSIVGSMTDFLRIMANLDIKMLESGNLVEDLMEKIRDALRQQILSGVVDEAPDAAAICILLYCAARMAKDRAKISVNFGSRKSTHPRIEEYRREYKTVDIFIAR